MAEASISFPLPRAQRRRIERAADAVDRILETDRRFFARHGDRNHRLRLMSAPEREQLAATNCRDDVPPPVGCEWAVAVRQVSPGVRLRVFVRVPRGADLDQSEAVSRSVYEMATRGSAKAAEVEASLRQAYGDAT